MNTKKVKYKKEGKKEKEAMSTALGIPRRSPIQVLTEPDVAYLRGSDENRCFQRGMAVDDNRRKINRYKPCQQPLWWVYARVLIENLLKKSNITTVYVC